MCSSSAEGIRRLQWVQKKRELILLRPRAWGFIYREGFYYFLKITCGLLHQSLGKGAYSWPVVKGNHPVFLAVPWLKQSFPKTIRGEGKQNQWEVLKCCGWLFFFLSCFMLVFLGLKKTVSCILQVAKTAVPPWTQSFWSCPGMTQAFSQPPLPICKR